MKLYCIIDGKIYGRKSDGTGNDAIVTGATFSEEYNETLDSGSIIVDQVEQITELEPFDDVYIFDSETDGGKFYKHMLVDSFQEELNNVRVKNYKYKINLFSETKRLEKVICPNLSITQPVDKTTRRSIWEYLNVYLNLYSPKIKIAGNNNNWHYKNKYSLSNYKYNVLPNEFQEVEYIESDGNQSILLGGIILGVSLELDFELVNHNHEKAIFGAGSGANHFMFRIYNDYYDWFGRGVALSPIEIGTRQSVKASHSKITINNVEYNESDTKTDDSDLYLFATNSSATDGASIKVFECKVYLGDNVVKDLIPCYRKSDNKAGLYDIIQGEFYSNQGSGDFSYKKLSKLLPNHLSVKEKFSDVDAPEISLTNPTLRDILTQLMLVKDCIPVVYDDTIDYIDVSERNNEFIINENDEYVNYIHGSMNSNDYSTEARREYSGALSQDKTCKMVEYLGFRNSDTSLMKIADLVLETRFPIYKINKIYMCYYKGANVKNLDSGENYTKTFIYKTDITPLVVQNVVRQSLKQNLKEFKQQSNSIQDIKDLSKWKMFTVGYDIGSNRITGWGEMYEYYDFQGVPGWFKARNTTLKNIVDFLATRQDIGSGLKGPNNIVEQNEVLLNVSQGIITGNIFDKDRGPTITDNPNSQKGIFFQIDYDAMFNGTLIHSKDFKNNDDLATVDNCSSSLTITEVDGLFEKEKLNRLGNKQYAIQARYDGPNAYEIMNNERNHILGSVYDDDIIIYHKEYQIYDNFILANYTGTFDYVLKNYFTSVFAKLRTYNLASYGESIVRAENYKEYVILSDESATYESGTLLYPYLDKYISCFNLTEVPTIVNNEANNSQINFAYINSENFAMSDVNVFCSGYSTCVNLKMYDNVTHGVYISDANAARDNEEMESVGAEQEWSIAVSNIEDAFQQNMTFGFGHLYQNGDIIDSGKQIFILENGRNVSVSEIETIYKNKLLNLPVISENNFLDTYTDYYITKNINICKDNKEIIDYTFQFETITNSENILFSSWFNKLNDFSGTYKKWEKTGLVINNASDIVSKIVGIQYIHDENIVLQQYKIGFLISVPKNFDFVLHPYKIEKDFPYTSKVFTTLSLQYSTTIYYYSWKPISFSNFDSQNKKIYLSCYRRERIIRALEDETIVTNETLVLSFSHSDDNFDYYVYETSFYSGRSDDENLNYYSETEIISDLIENNEQGNMPYTKNMFAIVSENKLKKEIIYDNYIANYIPPNEGENVGRIEIHDLPDYMHIINTDDENGNNYINFKNIFSYEKPDLSGRVDNSKVFNYLDDNISPILPQRKGQGSTTQFTFTLPHENAIVDSVVCAVTGDGAGRVTSFTNNSCSISILGFDLSKTAVIRSITVRYHYFDTNMIHGPLIHVGNALLSQYPNHKSIQFWYLDNNGEGSGKLQFVFGVNTEENTKDIYASVATRRAPFVFSEDHKTIVGTIKQMTPGNYTEENLFDYYEEEE